MGLGIIMKDLEFKDETAWKSVKQIIIAINITANFLLIKNTLRFQYGEYCLFIVIYTVF